MVQINQPNPGSDEALDRGCRCPVLDNGHGRGPGPFWINGDCPLHGTPLPQPTGRTMSQTYEEEIAEIKAGLADPAIRVVMVRAWTLGRLLASPPEPSEEEVARAWFGQSAQNGSRVGPTIRNAAQRVQQLFRSRRNG